MILKFRISDPDDQEVPHTPSSAGLSSGPEFFASPSQSSNTSDEASASGWSQLMNKRLSRTRSNLGQNGGSSSENNAQANNGATTSETDIEPELSPSSSASGGGARYNLQDQSPNEGDAGPSFSASGPPAFHRSISTTSGTSYEGDRDTHEISSSPIGPQSGYQPSQSSTRAPRGQGFSTTANMTTRPHPSPSSAFAPVQQTATTSDSDTGADEACCTDATKMEETQSPGSGEEQDSDLMQPTLHTAFSTETYEENADRTGMSAEENMAEEMEYGDNSGVQTEDMDYDLSDAEAIDVSNHDSSDDGLAARLEAENNALEERIAKLLRMTTIMRQQFDAGVLADQLARASGDNPDYRRWLEEEQSSREQHAERDNEHTEDNAEHIEDPQTSANAVTDQNVTNNRQGISTDGNGRPSQMETAAGAAAGGSGGGAAAATAEEVTDPMQQERQEVIELQEENRKLKVKVEKLVIEREYWRKLYTQITGEELPADVEELSENVGAYQQNMEGKKPNNAQNN